MEYCLVLYCNSSIHVNSKQLVSVWTSLFQHVITHPLETRIMQVDLLSLRYINWFVCLQTLSKTVSLRDYEVGVLELIPIGLYHIWSSGKYTKSISNQRCFQKSVAREDARSMPKTYQDPTWFNTWLINRLRSLPVTGGNSISHPHPVRWLRNEYFKVNRARVGGK